MILHSCIDNHDQRAEMVEEMDRDERKKGRGRDTNASCDETNPPPIEVQIPQIERIRVRERVVGGRSLDRVSHLSIYCFALAAI